MRRFERREDPFEIGQPLKRLQRLRVGHVRVFRAAQPAQPGVLGSDRRIVEARRNRMRQLDVPVLVLQHERPRALQHARAAAGESRGVAATPDRLAPGLDANQPHVAIADERIEDPHGVTAAADAGHDRGRQPAGELEDLRARFAADHRLELAHHQRVRMWTEHRAEQIVRVAHVGHPVAHRLVDRILERAAPRIHAADFCAQEPHPEDVERLPVHVFRAHVDVTLEPEQRARRRRRHAMLPRTSFGDDALLAHADGEERLAQRVVDLVRAGVRQILALEKHARAARGRRQSSRLVDRRRAARVVFEQTIQLGDERLVLACREIGTLQRLDRLDERLRHEAAAKLAEVAARVRIATGDACGRHFWLRRLSAQSTLRKALSNVHDLSHRGSSRRPTTHRSQTAARYESHRRRCRASARPTGSRGAPRRAPPRASNRSSDLCRPASADRPASVPAPRA